MQQLNHEKLSSLLRDFYHSTGRRIAIFDANGNSLMEYPKERCLFCSTIRGGPGELLCIQCDRSGLEQAAGGNTVIYRCHAGLLEVCAPITDNGVVTGYLMFGQLKYKSDAQEQYSITRAKTRRYFSSDSSFEDAYRSVQSIDEQSLSSTANIMSACVGYIQLEQLLNFQQRGLWEKICDYIHINYTHSFTLSDMAQFLSVSVPTLCRCARDNSGNTIIKLVTDRRIEKSKQYLATTSKSVSEISDLVGIADYNYFSRVFRKATGMSPKEWRKAN